MRDVIENVSFYRGAVEAIKSIDNFSGKRIMELGCGDGHIIEYFFKLGAKVEGTTFLPESDDYIRRRSYPDGLTVKYGVDLNRPLPIGSGEFDIVLSTEVIEHIEGHLNLLSEARRILKPGGYLVLTTPNLNRLISRLAFAFGGGHMSKQKHPSASVVLARIGERHQRCVDFPTLHWLLYQLGFRIERITTTETHLVSWLLFAVLWIFVFAGTKWFTARGHDGTAEDRKMRKDLFHWMMNPAALTSEQLCILAKVDLEPSR